MKIFNQQNEFKILAPDVFLNLTISKISHGNSGNNINTLQLRIDFEIGQFIVEYEQGGSKRAEYEKKILPELSK